MSSYGPDPREPAESQGKQRREEPSDVTVELPPPSEVSNTLTGLGEEAVPLPASKMERAGDFIGPYRLEHVVGSGGMGMVWAAHQLHPVRREVALKIIKPGMDSEQVIARFQDERQALALMDHPNIAKVLDAGTTESGRLFFVMELVSGVPITDYCTSAGLSLHDRLALFVSVCEAIQHAHQKGIIHRDIKPSNVLVVNYDGRAVPKVIDFGIAKVTDRQFGETESHTQIGTVIGTLEYMSPEQAGLTGLDIDTRSDIYSLGALLYELLTGSTPLDQQGSARAPQWEVLRQIREEQPLLPSSRLKRSKTTKTSNIASTGVHSLPQRRFLSKSPGSDLDWIVMRCLEKDRDRRYQTANDVARDIERYLNGDPVEASPPSATYRLYKFARKNHTLIASLAAFAVLLVAGTTISVWQAVRAKRAEQLALSQQHRANDEAANAKAVADFLQDDLLSQASAEAQGRADVEPDPDVRVRTLVDRAARRVGARFQGRPTIEAPIRATLANTYRNLGLPNPAEEQMRQAYELSRRARGDEDPATVEILLQLSYIYSDQGKYADCLRVSKKILEIDQRRLPPNSPKTAVAMQSLGVANLYTGDRKRAEDLFQKALAIQSVSPGYDHEDTLNTSDSLASLYIDEGKLPQAEALLKRGLVSYRKLFGPEHPFTKREMFGLARVYLKSGNYVEADRLTRDILESNRRLKGERHPDTLSTARLLSRILQGEGKFDESRRLSERVTADYTATLGADHPATLTSRSDLAFLADAQRDYPKAEAIWKQVLAGRRRSLGDNHLVTLETKELLADDWIRTRKFAAAEALLRESLAAREKSTPDDWHRFYGTSLLGASLLGEKRYAEAEPLLIAGYEGMKTREALIPSIQRKCIDESRERIVELHAALHAASHPSPTAAQMR